MCYPGMAALLGAPGPGRRVRGHLWCPSESPGAGMPGQRGTGLAGSTQGEQPVPAPGGRGIDTLVSPRPWACVCFAGINGKTLRSALGRHTPEPKSCHSNTAEPQPASLTLASIPNASPSWSRSSSQKSTTGTTSAHNSSGSSKISSVSLLSPQSPGELGWGSTGRHGQ